MIDDGEAYVPEGGLDPLRLFLEQATIYYLNAKRLEVSEKKLTLVRDLITSCKTQIKAEELAAQPPAADPSQLALPPASPMPPPTSPLIPNGNPAAA